jgi:glycosyltransferase involved in cell wall biosynthesis
VVPSEISIVNKQRICAVIPTYDNPATVADVVESVRKHVDRVILVDDGSGDEARAIAKDLADRGLAQVCFREQNGGKGAAVKTGLDAALAAGMTHALQIDADGQHDPDDIPRFLEASKKAPNALVLGQPVFDASAPKSRLWGRKVSIFWCMIETASTKIGDPLCGFRVYPVDAAVRAAARGHAMDFDPEIAVRLVWDGLPVVHVPTRVRYLSQEEGGVSHYKGFEDTVRISLMHASLCFRGLWRLVTSPFRRSPPSSPTPDARPAPRSTLREPPP